MKTITNFVKKKVILPLVLLTGISTLSSGQDYVGEDSLKVLKEYISLIRLNDSMAYVQGNIISLKLGKIESTLSSDLFSKESEEKRDSLDGKIDSLLQVYNFMEKRHEIKMKKIVYLEKKAGMTNK